MIKTLFSLFLLMTMTILACPSSDAYCPRNWNDRGYHGGWGGGNNNWGGFRGGWGGGNNNWGGWRNSGWNNNYYRPAPPQAWGGRGYGDNGFRRPGWW